MDAVILAGGFGTRLQPILPPNFPKALAEVDDVPFLSILFRHIASKGFRRVVLCCGHGLKVIEEYLQVFFDNGDLPINDVIVVFQKPSGTWPALVNALPSIESDPFFVFNGDTYCNIDCKAMLHKHQRKEAALTVAVDNEGSGVGTFLMAKRVLGEAVSTPNIEDALNSLSGVVRYKVNRPFWDIGTPASLEAFRKYWASRQ